MASLGKDEIVALQVLKDKGESHREIARRLGISVGKAHRYVTIVLDLDTGAVVFVGRGKGADALDPFWKRLRGSGARIAAVATDMSPASIQSVRENLPEATLVFDRFHVVKLFHEKLTKLRRELLSSDN